MSCDTRISDNSDIPSIDFLGHERLEILYRTFQDHRSRSGHVLATARWGCDLSFVRVVFVGERISCETINDGISFSLLDFQVLHKHLYTASSVVRSLFLHHRTDGIWRYRRGLKKSRQRRL